MARRHTFSNVATSDYPEHLNPFREDDVAVKESNGFGLKRNSRLTASFRLNHWPMFTKKSKNFESAPESSTEKTKFSTLTPRLSRHIFDVLTPRKHKKDKSVAVVDASPQYSTLPTRKPPAPAAEFTLVKSRQRFAPREPKEPEEAVPVPVPRVMAPPVPLPRTTLVRAESAPAVDTIAEPEPTVDNIVQPEPTVDNIVQPEPAEKAELEDKKYIRQGARPKKKRQAPPPPSDVTAIAETTESITSPETESPSPESNPEPKVEDKPVVAPLAVEEIDFTVKLHIDDDL